VLAIDENEQHYHDAGCPSWGPKETLLIPRFHKSANGRRTSRDVPDVVTIHRTTVQTQQQELRLVKFSTEVIRVWLIQSSFTKY
jgi:nuclear pore complex protein Nup98-Nup96